MSFLCKIGFHKYRDVGIAGLVMPVIVEQCQRCGCGRTDGGYYTEHFTPEQMREAIDAARHQEAGR